MPTRTIRDGLLDSAGVSELDEQSFALYIRLMLIVDDFGRFYADPRLLLARLFPLQLDRWSLSMVSESLSIVSSLRTSVSGVRTDDGNRRPLVSIYTVGGKKYLQINKFDQRLRQQKKKFPAPEEADSENLRADDSNLRADDSNSPQVAADCAHARAESESNPNPNPNPKPNPKVNFELDGVEVGKLYPKEMNFLGQQYLTQMVDTPEKLETFKRVIEARRRTREWESGFHKSFENYMKSGDWCTMPKDAIEEAPKPPSAKVQALIEKERVKQELRMKQIQAEKAEEEWLKTQA